MAGAGRFERGSWRRARRSMVSSCCGCELEEVVGGADQGPFVSDLVEAAQEELSEGAGGLDLAEDRFNDLLSQAISAAPPGPGASDRLPTGRRASFRSRASASTLFRPSSRASSERSSTCPMPAADNPPPCRPKAEGLSPDFSRIGGASGRGL